jgi:protoporphyrin/coproporphyrin ferrochelatase
VKKSLLLLNLGTPEAPTPEAVGPYLSEFLMDENVIDVPFFLRWFLVNVVIVPRRKHKSAEAYGQIWTSAGSPLMVNTKALKDSVQAASQSSVALAMRYGRPSLSSVLRDLRADEVDAIDFVPLYPQFAGSSTGTAIQDLRQNLSAMGWSPQVRVLKPFFAHPSYIKALVKTYQRSIAKAQFGPDFVLMSYHGVPKRHLTDLHKGCLQGYPNTDCCDEPEDRRLTCYRHQAYACSRALAGELKLSRVQWQVAFQSRLGPGWVAPFTDKVLEELPRRGVKRLAVFSPSFVADCLETLEEIDQRGREIFLAAGGEAFCMIPALNGDPSWAKDLTEFAHDPALWWELHPQDLKEPYDLRKYS